jgi:hypothetical protein
MSKKALHGRGPREIALADSVDASTSILIDRKLLPREEALALLGNAADELVSGPKQTTDVHVLVADIIRNELVPRV